MCDILFNFIVVCFFYTNILSAITAEEVFVKNDSLTIGIISAMPGERGPLLELMGSPAPQEKGRSKVL